MAGQQQERPLCRYYMHGACRYKNGGCPFSHDIAHAPSFVCKYFLRGECMYGDACRYDHVRPEWHAASSSRSVAGAATAHSVTPTAAQPPAHASALQLPDDPWRDGESEDGAQQQALHAGGHDGDMAGADAWGSHAYDAPSAWAAPGAGVAALSYAWHQQPAWQQQQHQHQQGVGDVIDPGLGLLGPSGAPGEGLEGDLGLGAPPHLYEEGGVELGGEADVERLGQVRDDPALRPLCTAYSATGTCPRGLACREVHGLLCEVCHKFVLHPANEQEAAQHVAECTARHARLAARLRSADVECGICLEKVLAAAAPSDRRFGLLACEHAFCLKCIRAWRKDGSADVDTAVRTCPVCRAPTNFITPSSVWPADEAEKETIIEGYKSKLASIDCQHFAMGDGTCPFGTSCFYRHMYRDGTLAEREVRLRTARAFDGGTHVLGGVRLSDYLTMPAARRALQGGGRARAGRARAGGVPPAPPSDDALGLDQAVDGIARLLSDDEPPRAEPPSRGWEQGAGSLPRAEAVAGDDVDDGWGAGWEAAAAHSPVLAASWTPGLNGAWAARRSAPG